MLKLKYKSSTAIPFEAELVTPDHLAEKTASEIAAVPRQHGNTQVPLAEFFDIQGDAFLRGFYEHYSGDLVSLGKGEILCYRRPEL